MKKYFSEQDSEGPELVNFQLSFWRMAVDKFLEIKENWEDFAVEDGEESDEYTANEFVVDAAVALVLAGTSVSELIGQNVAVNAKGDTPHLRPAYVTLLAHSIPPDVEVLFKIYDGLRHFGPAKHQLIKDISEDDFCTYMATAQRIWIEILQKLGASEGDDFRHKFTFEDSAAVSSPSANSDGK